jgi:hypothetical protein
MSFIIKARSCGGSFGQLRPVGPRASFPLRPHAGCQEQAQDPPHRASIRIWGYCHRDCGTLPRSRRHAEAT